MAEVTDMLYSPHLPYAKQPPLNWYELLSKCNQPLSNENPSCGVVKHPRVN